MEKSEKKQTCKLHPETKVEASIRIVKFVAPKAITINGYPSPCECTDNITCAYCVQASLIGYDKKLKIVYVTAAVYTVLVLDSSVPAARWPEAKEPVLVIGHQPTLGLAAAYLMTGARLSGEHESALRAW